VSSGSRTAYLLLAAVNALSYLPAGALVMRWRPPGNRPAKPVADATPRRGGYLGLLRDRALMLITG